MQTLDAIRTKRAVRRFTDQSVPCLLLVGEADARYPAVQECAKHMARATLVSLPGCNHATGFVRSDLVLPHVMRFLATVRS